MRDTIVCNLRNQPPETPASVVHCQPPETHVQEGPGGRPAQPHNDSGIIPEGHDQTPAAHTARVRASEHVPPGVPATHEKREDSEQVASAATSESATAPLSVPPSKTSLNAPASTSADVSCAVSLATSIATSVVAASDDASRNGPRSALVGASTPCGASGGLGVSIRASVSVGASAPVASVLTVSALEALELVVLSLQPEADTAITNENDTKPRAFIAAEG